MPSRRTTPGGRRVLFLAHQPLGDLSYGGGQRTQHILRGLSRGSLVDTIVIKHGQTYSITSSSDRPSVRTATYREGTGPIAALMDRYRVRRWLGRALDDGAYDLIVARYLTNAYFVPRRARSRMVLDGDDILKRTSSGISDRRTQSLARIKSRIRLLLVRRLLPQVAHVWFVNPRDMDELGPLARSASLLPNAAIEYTHQRSTERRDRRTMIVVGDHRYEPNREGVQFFIDDVLPSLRNEIPDLRLFVIGKVEPMTARRWSEVPNVEVKGFVPDVGVEYRRADLAIAPILRGGGSQIKVIEALANSCPVVASGFAYGGFSDTLGEGRDLLVARSAPEWVRMCREALMDSRTSSAMASAGRDVVLSSYGVDALVDEVDRTLNMLCSGLHPRSHD